MGILNGWINPRLLFPTISLVVPKTLLAPGTVDRSSQVEHTLHHLIPELTLDMFSVEADEHRHD